jgi:glycosyltransferase involved in cell wall biosynthesis
VIAGEGPLRAELESLVTSLDLAGRVTLPGFTANPYALMRRADFYILSSNAEGFPNGLVEAMAVGLPVLATDCPSGPSEILVGHGATGDVTEGRHGLLVPCNDVTAMNAGLRAISGAEERARLAALAKARAQDFAADATTEIYWNVIAGSLATH